MKIKYFNSILLIFLMAFSFISCADDAPIVPPSEILSAPPAGGPGSTDMTAIMILPSDGDTFVAADTDIELVFSENVDNTANNLTGNMTISGSVSGILTFPGDYTLSALPAQTVTINPTANFTAGETITVTTTTAILSTTANPLATYPAWTFTINPGGSSGTTDPYVVAGTQSPTGVGVSVSTQYIDVTFSEPVQGATVTVGSFTINGGLTYAVGVVSGNTYRLTINAGDLPLPNLTWYTVDLTNAILDMDGNPLIQDGQDTWLFQTE